VFPPFLDIIHAFGRKRGDQERTGSCFADRKDEDKKVKGTLLYSHWLVNFANGASESCFLLQHVEQHGREGQNDPWSIRQTGLYHRSDQALNQDTDIIVNPSDRLQERLKELKASTSAAANVNLLLMSTTTRNWRPYLDYLESRLDVLVSPGAIASR
jgi:hypothetical protein